MLALNYTLVIFATLAQFILGAIWYSPLMFGKWWMQIMEVTHFTKAQIKKMQKEMMPFYILQLLLTLFMTINLATLIKLIPQYTPYSLAFCIFVGFMVPLQVGSVIWANTKRKYWLKQIFVMLTYSLVSILLATFILSM